MLPRVLMVSEGLALPVAGGSRQREGGQGWPCSTDTGLDPVPTGEPGGGFTCSLVYKVGNLIPALVWR